MKIKEKEEILEKIKNLQEQLDNAVIEKESPFILDFGDKAYYNDYETIYEYGDWCQDKIQKNICCKNINIIKERQKREKLSALLERFTYENNVQVTEDMWNIDIYKYFIEYNYDINDYRIGFVDKDRSLSVIYFTDMKICQEAINKIVLPFMEDEK